MHQLAGLRVQICQKRNHEKTSSQRIEIIPFPLTLHPSTTFAPAICCIPMAIPNTLVPFNQKRMPGNHHQPRKLSAFDHLILACDKAAFFLTPNRQSYAQFNGTAAPLYSEQFRGWLLTRIEADGLAWPSASTLGRLLSAKILAPFLEEMDAVGTKGNARY